MKQVQALENKIGTTTDQLQGSSGIQADAKAAKAAEEKQMMEPRRLKKSAIKATAVQMEEEDMNVVLRSEVDEKGTLGSVGGQKLKMSKKIATPQTVQELLDTGLLEGYPVFYKGGNKGSPLRGTVKDGRILCTCSLCKGVTVVPPGTFEKHACKSYRDTNQYICLENGKSLIDVVKECGKYSWKAMEETIQNIIGPLPVKESITCWKCERLFLATPAAKRDQLCDSCLISITSVGCIMHPSYERIRKSDPVVRLQASENTGVQTGPKRRGRKKRKFSEMVTKEQSSSKSSISTLSKRKSRWNIPNLSSSLSPTSCPKASKSASTCGSPQSKIQWKIIKHQKMHKLIFKEGGLPEGAVLNYYSRGQELLSGYKIGLGIFCSCCKNEVSPSTFEAHAGWASREKPYEHIYMSNGVSLHELVIKLLKGCDCTTSDNGDLSTICAEGGKLVLCDTCPTAFHEACASLAKIPHGKWCCKYCQNMFQRERFMEHNANAVAAGRVPGIDPIEQITNGCIRIVKNPKAENIACIICRAYDFSRCGFGPRTVIVCDQCEGEYHVGCLKKQKMADLKKKPKGKWFCSGDCKKINSALCKVVSTGSDKLQGSCLDVIKKKQMLEGSEVAADFDVSWRVLSAQNNKPEVRSLLSKAVEVLYDCFDPIVDSVTKGDFIPSMVFGRKIGCYDFGGMYCAILTVNSCIVSTVLFRIFGHGVAELPLAATSSGNQGKGYFQLLYTCVEKLLSSLRIRSLVLPAADEAESMWTEKFGFKRMSDDQIADYRITCWQMMRFEGTHILEKMVPLE